MSDISDAIQVRLGEDISGRFVDSEIALTFVGDPGWSVGEANDFIASNSYTVFNVADVRKSAGLTTIAGESRFRVNTKGRIAAPFGFAVTAPQTPKHAFEMLMDYFGLPYDPVPDIKLRLDGTNTTIPTVQAVIVTWDTSANSKAPTVFEVLEAFLKPYEGYVLRMNGFIYFKLVAPGWSDNTIVPTLITDADILENGLTVSAPRDTVVNYATVKSRGYEFVANQLLGARSVFDAGNDAGITTWVRDVFVGAHVVGVTYNAGDAVLYNGGRYRAKVGNNTLPTTVADWEVSAKNGFKDIQDDHRAPIDVGAVVNGGVTIALSGVMNYDYAAPLASDGTIAISQTVVLAQPGDILTIALPDYDIGSGTIAPNFQHDSLVLIWQSDSIQVEFQPRYANPVSTGSGLLWRAYRIFVQLTGNKYQESAGTITGIFGLPDDTSALAGLQDSQDAFGVREVSIDTGGLRLDATTALAMARGIVERGMTPDRVYDVGLVPPHVAQTNGLGSPFELPDGQIGTLESWSYSEGHSASSSTSSCAVRIRVI